MRCLILAGERGDAVSGTIACKLLLPVAGLPLLERTIATAAQAGATDFYVLAGCHQQHLRAFLSDVSSRRKLRITVLPNDERDGGDSAALLRARVWLGDTFLLLRTDHVVSEEVLRALMRQPLREADIILAGVRGCNATAGAARGRIRVLVDGNCVIDAGDGIESGNAYDAGMLLCSPAIFPAAEETLREGELSLRAIIGRLARAGRVRLFDVGDGRWTALDTPDGVREAESKLYASLGKSHDGFVSRTVNRKLSVRLFTPLLLRAARQITPNQVSLLSFGVGLAASASFFLRRPLAGGLLTQLASVLDGSDGEVARLKKMQSRFGTFLDALLDRYADSFILSGMSYYACTNRERAMPFGRFWTPLALTVSLLATFGHLMVSYTSARSVADFGYRYSGGWTAAGRGRDVRLLALCLGGVLTRLHPAAVVAALLAVAVQTNAIVLRRVGLSRQLAQHENPFLDGPVKAIIYDFDGTIADTMAFLMDSAVELMVANYGISAETARARYRDTIGMDFASQIERIFPCHAQNADVIAAFEAKKRERLLDYPLVPGATATLAFFRGQGVKQFVCSSTAHQLVSAYLRKYQIDAYIDGCLGHERNFTKDGQIELVLREHDLTPDEVIFVTDAPKDADFVRDRGIRLVGTPRLFAEHEFRTRGFTCVQDLATLARLWREARSLIELVEPA